MFDWKSRFHVSQFPWSEVAQKRPDRGLAVVGKDLAAWDLKTGEPTKEKHEMMERVKRIDWVTPDRQHLLPQPDPVPRQPDPQDGPYLDPMRGCADEYR